MRRDMKWILGDKRGSRLAGPRKGRRFSSAEFRKYDWDEDDSHFVAGHVGQALEIKLVGMRRWRGGYKGTLIARFLNRRVGRDWNDVFSEIRTALRGADIAEANWPWILTGDVATRTQLNQGEVLFSDWRGALLPLTTERAPKFYVDPHDGCLRRNTSIETHRMRQKRLAAEDKAERDQRMRVLSPIRQLHLLADGNWWEVKLEILQPAYQRGFTEDVVQRANLSGLSREKLYGRRDLIAVDKRQLSAKEMKRFGLRPRL